MNEQSEPPVHEFLSPIHGAKENFIHPMEQAIADAVRQGNAERTRILVAGLKQAAKAADLARVAMNKLFSALRNLANELEESQ